MRIAQSNLAGNYSNALSVNRFKYNTVNIPTHICVHEKATKRDYFHTLVYYMRYLYQTRR